MHNVGEALDALVMLHLDCSEAAYPAQIVAPEVNQHIMLGKLLFVGEELRFKLCILLVGLSSGACSRQREGVQHAVFELDQRFGRGSRYLHIRAREVEHIRRGVCSSQYAVGVQQAPLVLGAEAVGEDYLEDVSLGDVPLRPLYHRAELLL